MARETRAMKQYRIMTGQAAPNRLRVDGIEFDMRQAQVILRKHLSQAPQSADMHTGSQ
jgi:hypothetical protein